MSSITYIDIAAFAAKAKKKKKLQTLTVREVKVIHMPPKPLKVRAMKIRTESSGKDTHWVKFVSKQMNVFENQYNQV